MILRWLKGRSKSIDMRKFLIVGLGNIGADYKNTRHNIGFEVIDYIAEKYKTDMDESKLCKKGVLRFKGKKIILIKPSTLMNRSGKAVRYWAFKENIAIENILVVADDLHLPLAKLRLKGKGSDGGHNGLKDIEAQLNTPHYCRLRFGIGQEQKAYDQVKFVLDPWDKKEEDSLPKIIEKCTEAVICFGLEGINTAMNKFNGSI